MRKKVRRSKVEEVKGMKISAVMFDERIDKTKCEVGIGIKGKKRYNVQKEEHCAIVGYPGEHYLGHVVPKGGTAKELAETLHEFLSSRTDIAELSVSMSDGCNKMGGWKSGCHAELEELIERPLQRGFCMAHAVEKPYEHLFHYYDGKTTGPESWSGDIGKELMKEVWLLDVVDFVPVINPELLSLIEGMSPEVLAGLSHDVRYLIEQLRAVTSGVSTERWTAMKAGKMATVRWTNPQSRLLRLYQSTEEPSFAMQRLVNFLVYVYGPTFLSVRIYNNLSKGSNHLLQEVTAVSDNCTEAEKEVI